MAEAGPPSDVGAGHIVTKNGLLVKSICEGGWAVGGVCDAGCGNIRGARYRDQQDSLKNSQSPVLAEGRGRGGAGSSQASTGW